MWYSHPCTVSNKHSASWCCHGDTAREAAVFIIFQACSLSLCELGMNMVPPLSSLKSSRHINTCASIRQMEAANDTRPS